MGITRQTTRLLENARFSSVTSSMASASNYFCRFFKFIFTRQPFEIWLKRQHFAAWTSPRSNADDVTYLLAGMLLAGTGSLQRNPKSPTGLIVCALVRISQIFIFLPPVLDNFGKTIKLSEILASTVSQKLIEETCEVG